MIKLASSMHKSNAALPISAGSLPNGDGKPDLAVSNNLSLTISVLRNASNPGALYSTSFQSQVDITVGSNPISVRTFTLDQEVMEISDMEAPHHTDRFYRLRKRE